MMSARAWQVCVVLPLLSCAGSCTRPPPAPPPPFVTSECAARGERARIVPLAERVRALRARAEAEGATQASFSARPLGPGFLVTYGARPTDYFEDEGQLRGFVVFAEGVIELREAELLEPETRGDRLTGGFRYQPPVLDGDPRNGPALLLGASTTRVMRMTESGLVSREVQCPVGAMGIVGTICGRAIVCASEPWPQFLATECLASPPWLAGLAQVAARIEQANFGAMLDAPSRTEPGAIRNAARWLVTTPPSATRAQWAQTMRGLLVDLDVPELEARSLAASAAACGRPH